MSDIGSILLNNSNLRYIDKRLLHNPQLTVAICCYQQEVFVVESLSRAHQLQSLLNLELLFIDDGSSDKSFDTALEWQSSSGASALLITKENAGLVDSLNMALNLANAPFIFFISADDLLCPNSLLHLVNLINSNSHLCFAMGNSLCFGVEIKKQPAYNKLHKKFLLSPSIKRPGYLPSKLPGSLLIQTVVFRTEYLSNLGGWDPKIRLDDLQLFVRLFSMQIESGIDYTYDHDLYVSEYRYHTNNTHRRLLYQFEIYEEFIRKAINKPDQPSEYSFALAMYILQALLKKNIKALRYFTNFAKSKHLLWLTFYEMVKRIMHKVVTLISNKTDIIFHVKVL
jgi:alpha-1,3-rhamnosyltransferase